MYKKNIFSGHNARTLVGYRLSLANFVRLLFTALGTGGILVSKNVPGLVQLYNLNMCCPDGKCSKN